MFKFVKFGAEDVFVYTAQVGRPSAVIAVLMVSAVVVSVVMTLAAITRVVMALAAIISAVMLGFGCKGGLLLIRSAMSGTGLPCG